MNERVVKVGGQLKQAFGKLGDTWKGQDSKKRRRVVYGAAALLLFALAVMIVLNITGGSYRVLYEGMSRDESVMALSALETAGISARLNGEGQLEVPGKDADRAMGQLSLQNIPSTTLDYNVFAQASGLTTTETEKREYMKLQWQDRLQSIIKTYDGVQNAFVTLNINTASTRAWDVRATKNSGSVSLVLEQGYVIAPQQVTAIRHMVGASVGIAPEEVVILDQHKTLLAAAGDTVDVATATTSQFLERMGLEEEVENRLIEKASTMLSLPYPQPEDYRIACDITLDFDAVVEEIKTYLPLGDTDHGVVDSEELNAVMGLGQYAEGVAGETDNTDVPVYVDNNGDGVADTVDYARYRDFAVSYILQQITRDGPKETDAHMSVAISGVLSAEDVQNLRQMVAQATALPVENVGVASFTPTGGQGTVPAPVPGGQTLFGIDILYFYIAGAAVAALILVLLVVLILRRRGKKKRLAAERAELMAEQEEARRIQMEIEERKKQLKNAAIGDQSENAITNEVREFARNNPEITANLLRNWLKEGE